MLVNGLHKAEVPFISLNIRVYKEKLNNYNHVTTPFVYTKYKTHKRINQVLYINFHTKCHKVICVRYPSALILFVRYPLILFVRYLWAHIGINPTIRCVPHPTALLWSGAHVVDIFFSKWTQVVAIWGSEERYITIIV